MQEGMFKTQMEINILNEEVRSVLRSWMPWVKTLRK